MAARRNVRSSAAVLLSLALLVAAACASDRASAVRHLTRADALVHEGLHAEAVLEYRNALKLDPKHGEARLKLADAYLETRNRPAAAEELIRAADLLPQRVDVQLRAAALLLTVREFASARKYADAALGQAPANVDALVIRALALSGLGDVGAALQELETAMLAAPADARPHIALGSIRADAAAGAAESAFRQAVDADPSSVNARTALGLYLWQRGRLDEAQQTLEALVAASPADLLANRIQALFLLAQQREQAAEGPLTRLIETGDETAAIVLADLHTRRGRILAARPLYDRIPSSSPRFPLAAARLAGLDYAAGRANAARQRIEAALATYPNHPALLIADARWLLSERRRSEAVEAARRAVAANDDSAEARFVLGLAYTADGNDDAAVHQMREALRLDPRMSAADVELSRLTLRPGSAGLSMEHAASAVAAAPRDYAARLTFARALAGNGQAPRARDELEALVRVHPKAAPVHALLGEVLSALGDTAGAFRRFDAALALDPSEPTALAARVGQDLDQGRAGNARARIAAALDANPRRAAVLILAAELEHVGGDEAAAERYIRRAIEAEPSNARAYGQLAHLYVAMNRLEDGKQTLRDFVAGRPDAVAARTMIGLIEELQGRTDDAVATYERILASASRAPVAANNLAYVYLERGVQLERALQLAQDARQLLPADPNVRDTLGWAYFKNGMTKEAIDELERTVEEDPRNAGFLLHLGLAYEKAGRLEKAQAAIERALALDPGHAQAGVARARLASTRKRAS